MQKRDPILQFIRSTSKLSFADQWIKWTCKLQSLQKQSQLRPYLERFNQYFPFNTKYWVKLAYLQLQKGKPQCIKIFQLALAKNPKSASLWKQYFIWLKEAIEDSDPEFLLTDLQRGFEVIGKHPESKLIYDYWFSVAGQKDIKKVYLMRKKMIDTMLCLNEKVVEEAVEWLKEQSGENLIQIAKVEWITEQNKDKLLEQLIQRFHQDVEKSLQKYKNCKAFEEKLSTSLEYKPYEGSTAIWRSYIQNTKIHNQDELPDIYQRALIANSDNQQIWKQFFWHLQFQSSNVSKVLTILRSIPVFFKNFSVELTCYWIELEQAQNVYQARDLVLQMIQSKNKLQYFNKHIQLEIRSKNFSNAKAIYESILNVFSNNFEIVSYTLVEYTEFLVKYFRDIELSKKLFRSHFQKHSFSKYLFRGYLEFYLKHVEMKSENKELINEFVAIVKSGIIKAFKSLEQEEYKEILSSTTHLMRTYLPNIFSLKSAEKEIIQTELLMKNQELEEIRQANLNRFDGIQTLSKRRKLDQAKQDNRFQTLY